MVKIKNMFVQNGIKYVHTLPWYSRLPFKICSGIQYVLWKVGIDWHMNWFGGQCTPNFSCCIKKFKSK